MKYTWARNKKKKLLVFFNGWGCDENPFKHLVSNNYDVLIFYDYRNLALDKDILNSINEYEEVNIAAWSYGVWVGQFVWQEYKLHRNKAIAINGTTLPIHDKYGISETVTHGTLNSLTERNLMKFQRRMVGGNEGWKLFEKMIPQIKFEEQKKELAALINHFEQNKLAEGFYSKAIVGTKDLIFTTENQLVFWNGRAEVAKIDAPHYCFFDLRSWDELLA